MRDTAVEMLCARWTTLWSHTEQIPASHFTSISHFGGRMKGNINEAFLPEMRRSASFGVICIRFWRRELNEKPNFERKFITISSNRKRRASDEFNVMFSFEIKWISLPFTLCQRFPRTSKRFPRFRRSNFMVKVAGEIQRKKGDWWRETTEFPCSHMPRGSECHVRFCGGKEWMMSLRQAKISHYFQHIRRFPLAIMLMFIARSAVWCDDDASDSP